MSLLSDFFFVSTADPGKVISSVKLCQGGNERGTLTVHVLCVSIAFMCRFVFVRVDVCVFRLFCVLCLTLVVCFCSICIASL